MIKFEFKFHQKNSTLNMYDLNPQYLPLMRRLLAIFLSNDFNIFSFLFLIYKLTKLSYLQKC